MQTFSTIFFCLIGGIFAVIGLFIVADVLTADAPQDGETPWDTFAFGVVFAAVGIVLFMIGLRKQLTNAQHEELRRKLPDQPWQRRDDWRSGRIEHNEKWQAIALLAFMILWNGLVSMAMIFGGKDMLHEASEDPTAYLFLLFPLAGLVLLLIAVRSTLQWKRYGTSTLILRSVPVRMGGQLEATVQLPPDVRSAAELNVRVACTRTTRKGKNTTTSILWSDVRSYPGMALGVGPTGPTLSVRQEIPKGFEQSSVGAVNPSIDWKVEISAEVAGVDFHADYTIPVFTE